jgi:hypothetical protein
MVNTLAQHMREAQGPLDVRFQSLSCNHQAEFAHALLLARQQLWTVTPILQPALIGRMFHFFSSILEHAYN